MVYDLNRVQQMVEILNSAPRHVYAQRGVGMNPPDIGYILGTVISASVEKDTLCYVVDITSKMIEFDMELTTIAPLMIKDTDTGHVHNIPYLVALPIEQTNYTIEKL